MKAVETTVQQQAPMPVAPAPVAAVKAPAKADVKPAAKADHIPEDLFKELTSKAAAGGKQVRVQLASFPDQAAGQAQMAKMQSKYAAALNGAHLHLVRADLAKGTYYRVQSDALSDAKARALCAALTAQKAACIVVKP